MSHRLQLYVFDPKEVFLMKLILRNNIFIF